MKKCTNSSCRWEWPDSAETCSVCGSQELKDASVADPPIATRHLPSCCPSAECQNLMFFSGAKYCSECGSNLKPVSWEAWEKKVVYPAFEKDIAGVAFDPSQVLKSASKMGFIPEEAESRFNELFKHVTHVSRMEFGAWLKESVLPLQEDKTGSAAPTKEALLQAKRLKISEIHAERVLSQVVPPPNIASESEESSAGSETPRSVSTAAQQPPLIQQTIVASLETNQAVTDPNRSSAKSFYRRLVAGGSVTNNLTYLDFKKSASKKGLTNSDEILRETSAQGAFVLFVSSDDQGWVFPNPTLIFATDFLKPLFPTLTAEQYNNFKGHIEPVPVVRIGKARWQVRSSDKSSDNRRSSATATEPKTAETAKPAMAFPISADDYIAKVQTSLSVVTHDIVKNILVSGPDGKGELALIRNSKVSTNNQSLFAIPRITRFLSTDAFHIFYKDYYACAKPSIGEVWILNPAVVSEVPGGWQLRQKGVLEVRDYGSTNDQGEGPFSRDLSESPPAIGEKEPEPLDIFGTSPERDNLKRVLFIVTIVAIFFAIGFASLWPTRTIQLPRTTSENPGPPPSAQAPMVQVPGGVFQMGSDDGDEYERPQHQVTLRSFLIDTYEVTSDDYEKFLKANPKHKSPPGWVNKTPPAGRARRPVTGVDWYDANAFAQWAGKRLPSEEEWEFAARGTTGWRYPWGKEWRVGSANADGASKGLADVGTYKGASPAQAYDMVGNAWEWTASKLVAYPGGRLAPASGDLRVIRGGSWESDKDSATTTYRNPWPARGGKDYSNTGFRCVKDIPSGPK